MASQQKGGDRYCVILILLHKLLLRAKFLAVLSLNHLDVCNKGQSILAWFGGFLLHVMRRKNENKLYLFLCYPSPTHTHIFYITLDLIFIKSQFHKLFIGFSKHCRTSSCPDHTRPELEWNVNNTYSELMIHYKK